MLAIFGALVMGAAFGFLLQRGKVTSCNVIENQFRLRDFTVLKVMGTAIVVGGIGVLLLVDTGNSKYYVKDANMLAVALGAALFGVGMVVYGYCPGTALGAIATGSVHALVGALGMVAGAILYALSFDWLKGHVLNVWALGKVRLPDLTGVPDAAWFIALAIGAGLFFWWVETSQPKRA
ncbi:MULTISPECIES: YeeE/YedE thiosulfate transporter family protein [Bradyrhizobium]|uniref:YeeE/YedE thiosulfate transporter family protein n=1 Tax=Bradyrhizobium TaxID=374 RepID=UPI001B8A0C8E|nr:MULTISPECIES: YeeE/YedE thiosulfate transporter family protein [Bradyrhizobium]MBR0970604.1 YeeE/YedE family protein [Bradyrhizobium japonicum]